MAAELTNTGEMEGGGFGEERDTEEDSGETVGCAASSASALSTPTFSTYSRGAGDSAGERGTADSAGGEVAACGTGVGAAMTGAGATTGAAVTTENRPA